MYGERFSDMGLLTATERRKGYFMRRKVTGPRKEVARHNLQQLVVHLSRRRRLQQQQLSSEHHLKTQNSLLVTHGKIREIGRHM